MKNYGPLIPDEADILVEMGNWEQAQPSQTIGTLALGPCIGVALYDTRSSQGFLVHTAGPETTTITEMLNHVSAQGITAKGLRAWLSGALELSVQPGDEDFYDRIRQTAFEVLINAGIPERHIQVEWLTDGIDDYSDMILDCSTGKCLVVQGNYYDLLEEHGLTIDDFDE